MAQNSSLATALTVPKPNPLSTLNTSQCKARYGVSYLRVVCSHFGVGLMETSTGEDVNAVDCVIDFKSSPARVQVKCTSSRKPTGRSLSLKIEPEWQQSWQESDTPVYLVVVLVPAGVSKWVEYGDATTQHATVAYWARIAKGQTAGTVKIPKSQRLTDATMSIWASEVKAAFGGGA